MSQQTPIVHYWVTIANKQVIYKIKVASKEEKIEILKEREENLLFNKISFIEVFEKQQRNLMAVT